jgi:hypothetical protein
MPGCALEYCPGGQAGTVFGAAQLVIGPVHLQVPGKPRATFEERTTL